MWILLLMIAIMPFEENPHLRLADNFLGVFPYFTAVKLLGLVGLAWAALQLLAGRASLRALVTSQSRAFALFISAIVVGAVASGAGLATSTRVIAIVGLLPLVAISVRTERDLKKVVSTCALVIVGVFPYALRQQHRFGGERLGVGLQEANYFALSLVLLLPLPFVLARSARGYLRRLWLAAGLAVLVELILTGSRGGFLALLVTLFLLTVRLSETPGRALAAGTVALLAVLLIVPNPMAKRLMASVVGQPAAAASEGPSYDERAALSSDRARSAILAGGLKMVADHPLTGVGLGNFKARLLDYTDSDYSNVAHNAYLEVAAEAGLPALAAFLAVIITTFLSLERSRRSARRAGARHLVDLAAGLEAGLGGYLLGSLFLSAQYEKFFWLVMFLSISLERLTRRRLRASQTATLEAAT